MLTPGERIRVTVPEAQLERLVGELLTLDQDSLVVESKGKRWTLPRAGVTEVERFGGTHGHTGRGALIGGVLVGGFAGLAVLSNLGQCEGDYGALCTAFVTDSFLAGAAVGALVGTLIRHDEWIPVSPGSNQPRASVFISPARMSGRPALVAGVTVRF